MCVCLCVFLFVCLLPEEMNWFSLEILRLALCQLLEHGQSNKMCANPAVLVTRSGNLKADYCSAQAGKKCKFMICPYMCFYPNTTSCSFEWQLNCKVIY